MKRGFSPWYGVFAGAEVLTFGLAFGVLILLDPASEPGLGGEVAPRRRRVAAAVGGILSGAGVLGMLFAGGLASTLGNG